MDTTHQSLLLRIRDPADTAAWRQFDEIYRPMLRRFALARGLDDSAADDVVQHAMLAVSTHIQSFEYDPARGRFKAWLRTIVGNHVRNLLARRREKLADSVDMKRPDDRAESPDELFDRLWLKEHLDHAMARLRDAAEPAVFAAFEAYVLNDEPVDDVCQRLGMTPNQLYSIKFRLTRKLGECMKSLVGDDA